ncbi:MAG TPA: diguanylate cyclase [Acidiferrobacterales bacterium]|jgi:diguanylate cyclase (GGDEF)-like protein
MAEKTGQAPDGAARIVVTDDSLVIRKAIQKMLHGEFDVVLAGDGEAGWNALAADEQVKVLITDIEMPGLDGYGLICRIRAADDPRVRDLPVIAITGAEDEETKARALACGATDFIVKPIDQIQLKARVHAQVRFTQTTRLLAETEAALEDQATTDPLTLLSSRRYFLQRGEQDLAHALRHGEDLTVLRLDIDQLKAIYRQHGDDVVDQVLVWLGKLLVGATRTEDTVARIGGAEFAILAPVTDRAEADVLCQRILAALRAQPFAQGAFAIPITVSLGLASLPDDDAEDIEGLIAIAERRLRYAKADGGDRVATEDRQSAAAALEEVTLASPAEPSGEVPAPAARPARPQPLREIVPPREPMTAASADQGNVVELLSIDRALLMLMNGEAARIEPWLEGLVPRVLPLLEAYNRKTGAGLDAAIADMKARFSKRIL